MPSSDPALEIAGELADVGSPELGEVEGVEFGEVQGGPLDQRQEPPVARDERVELVDDAAELPGSAALSRCAGARVALAE